MSAALVFGSVALGQVDTLSDTDMLVVCTEVPALPERERVILPLGLTFTTVTTDSPLFCDQDSCLGGDGLVLSLHYQRTAWMASVIAEVLGGGITTEQLPFRPYALLGLLQRGWLLSDKHALIAGWRAQMHPTLNASNGTWSEASPPFSAITPKRCSSPLRGTSARGTSSSTSTGV